MQLTISINPNMASTPPHNFFKISTTSKTPKRLRKYQPVRSQLFGDEGKSGNYNIVDANMNILRRRIEQERMKENLNRAYWHRYDREQMNGWIYKAAAGYDDAYKKGVFFKETFDLVASAASSIGLVLLTGSIFVFLYSLLLHHVNFHT